MTAASPAVESTGTVVMDTERCKGCELCIPACPPRVLVMSEGVNGSGFRFPMLEPGCIGCALCHAVCPDFVFEVYRFPAAPSELPAQEQTAQDRGTP